MNRPLTKREWLLINYLGFLFGLIPGLLIALFRFLRGVRDGYYGKST